MRLGVSMLAIHTPGGIGRYARILGATLLTQYKGELHLFLQRKDDLSLILNELPQEIAASFRIQGNVALHTSKIACAPRYLIHQIEIPKAFVRLKLDAYFDPDYILPPMRGVVQACVIHDTTPFTSLRSLGVKAKVKYGISSRKSLAQAERLIVGSPCIRDSLSALFPCLASKIRVVEPCLTPKLAEACGTAYRPQSFLTILTEYGEVNLPLPFILYVGVPGPRKNLGNLLKAFSEAKLRMFRHRLVLVGGRAKPPSINRKQPVPQVALPNGAFTQSSADTPEVIHLGKVSDEDLIGLYRHADLLVMPSLEEGFGYPVLEAVSFRTPAIITANSPLSGLPGVASFSNVRDYSVMAQEIEEALRGLPLLAAELSTSNTSKRFRCECYMESLLGALQS